MEEEDGRLPARVSPVQTDALAMGDKVLAFDGEGTECWALVDEIAPQRRYVMLSPINGSARDSVAMAVPDAMNASLA